MRFLTSMIEVVLKRAGAFRRSAAEKKLRKELSDSFADVERMENQASDAMLRHEETVAALRHDLQLSQDHVARLEQQIEFHALLAEDMRQQIERNIAVAGKAIVGK